MSSTARIQVDNTTFLIERLAQDCSPRQYVRELTQNSFEAIESRRKSGFAGKGLVQWDIDWQLAALHGIYKLQISDNGKGMSGSEIEQYINHLSSSSGTQSMEENFGIGAKITAGVENPFGLVYKSWQKNHGVMAHFWKDYDANSYGLKQLQVGENFAHFVPIDDRLKPLVSSNQKPLIEDFGTVVTLLGKSDSDNTYFQEGLKQKWLIEYLNSRYFEFPSETVVTVRDFNNADPARWPTSLDTGMGPGGSQLRTIVGMKELLQNNCESEGTVQLSKAKAHWWILPEGLNVSGGVWYDKYHVATLFQTELYDIQRSHSARTVLQSFGIIYGHGRVVLYIEPDTQQLNVYANTARSKLLVDGVDLPWDRWAQEFRSNIPGPISRMMQEIMEGVDTSDYEDAVKRRLHEIKDLYEIQRYRLSNNGPLLIDGELPGGTSRETDEKRNTPSKSGTKENKGGSTTDLYGAFINPEGVAGEEIKQKNNLPQVQFISLSAGTRELGQMEDRAAKYLHEVNVIQVNEDFRVFEAMTNSLRDKYPHAEPVEVKRSMNEWITLQLTEVVLGIQSLQGSPEWSDRSKLESALSEESLTAAIMPRYAIFSQMKRQLSSRTGASVQINTEEDEEL